MTPEESLGAPAAPDGLSPDGEAPPGLQPPAFDPARITTSLLSLATNNELAAVQCRWFDWRRFWHKGRAGAFRQAIDIVNWHCATGIVAAQAATTTGVVRRTTSPVPRKGQSPIHSLLKEADQ